MTNTLTIEPRTAQEVWVLAQRVKQKRKMPFISRTKLIDYVVPDNYTISVVEPLTQPPKLSTIMETAAHVFGYSRTELLAQRRDRELVYRRQVCMYAMYKLTTCSYPAIGRFLRRDHSTVVYGVQCVTNEPAKYAHLVKPLMAALGSLET